MNKMNQYRKAFAAILSNLAVLGTAVGVDWASDLDPSIILAVASILAMLVNLVVVERIPNAATDDQRREMQDEPQVQAKDVQDLADTAQTMANDAKPTPMKEEEL